MAEYKLYAKIPMLAENPVFILIIVPPAGIQKEQSLGGVCNAAVIPGEIRLPML